MAKASRADADKHRAAVVTAAARLFRERGLNGVSIPDVMADAGLTHGGFYRNFASKDQLAAEACGAAFDEMDALLADISQRNADDPRAALTELVDTYLSSDHRDQRGTGCPSAGLCGDVARETPKSAVRAAYVEGVRGMVRSLSRFTGRKSKVVDRRDDDLIKLATLVGALVLSRATRGDSISDDFLTAARTSLLAPVR